MLGRLKNIVMHRHRIVSLLCALGAWLTVSSHAANLAPTANADSYSVNEDTRLSVNRAGVLTNDLDPEGATLTAILLTAPPNGTLTFTNNGGFAYTPRTNFFGVDSFTYRARDTGGSNSAPATVTITVHAVNDAPRATNNSYNLNSDVLNVRTAPGVLGNDGDVDGDALSAELVSNVARGVLVLNGDGSFSYTPDAGFFGTDSFTYRALDGLTNSATATVTLNVSPAPLVVTAAPASQTVCGGATVSFSVEATGTALTYQWFKDTTLLAEATNSTLVLNNVGASETAPYSVRLTGATNSVTNSATLTVNLPVSTPALANAIRMVGSIIVFDATAMGAAPITYSWLRNGEIIPGQNGGTLTLSNLLTGDSGTYSVIVGNSCGSVTNRATLTVEPCFNQFDVVLVIDRSGSMVGQAYTDARTAASNFVHNLHLTAETNDTLGLVSYNPTSTLNQPLTNSPLVMEEAIQALGPATNGTCISCGIITAQAELTSARRRSNALPVMILLTDGIPKDFDTPSNAFYHAQLAKNAGTRVFTVAFGTNIDPALMTGMASSASDYFYASNSSQLGALFDAISTVICRPPTNIFGPNGTTVCAGANVNLEVTASGCANFYYQWHQDGVPLAGQTNATLTLNNTVATDSGDYSVVVSSVCRTVTNHAQVTVNAPAQIVTPAAFLASYLGSNAVFEVAASGTRLSYEWSFNGTVLGTNSSLALSNLTAFQAGTYSVVIVSADCGGPVTNSATLTILNRPPTANADGYTTAEDATLIIAAPGVLANDLDPDGDALSAVLVSSVAHGTLDLSANGAFIYTPSLNYTGVDTFTYRTDDGVISSGIATVTITVTPVNDAPVALNDAYTVAEDATLLISVPGVLANDTDLDNDTLTAVLVSSTAHGTLELSANGAFIYTPSLNYTGVDTFTYRASDGVISSGIATVTITVTPVNDGPVALADSYFVNEDTTFVIAVPGVLSNDSDVDGDALTVTLVNSVANGNLNLSANGSFTYTPSLHQTGAVTFTYTVTDGLAVSGPATVTITITPLNDMPVAANDAYTTVEDTILTVAAPGLLANDGDVDGDALSAVLVTGVSQGSLEMSADGAFTYAPSLNFTGLVTFTYRATDGAADSAPATVSITVTPVNDAPVARADEFTTLEDTLLTIPMAGILTNDFDVDGDALSAVLVTDVAHGTLALSADGSFTYLPNANFHGEDSFLYRAFDSVLHSETTLVRIQVISTNDAPVAVNDSYATAEDTTLNISVPGVILNDTDADGDALTAQLVSNVMHGTLVLNANGSFSYTPSLNYHGADSFTYQITDGLATSGVATVNLTITSVNDQPLGVAGENDIHSVLEDQILTVPAPGVLANDSDPDGDTLTAVLISGVSHGTLALQANGSFIYTPTANYFGGDSFIYVANDGLTNSAPVVVSLTVTSVNDVPTFNVGASQRVNFNAGAQSIANWASRISAGPANESAQSVHFELSNNNAALFAVPPAVSAAGTLTYTPAGTSFGVATLTLVLQDDGGVANGGADLSIEKTFSITLNGPPVISIINPTNGTTLVGTNNITVIAQASDSDSVITNVTIFNGTNVLSSGTNTPYFAALLNAPFGTYAFRAVAVDDLGLRATSSIVTVTVTQSPPVTALGPIVLNHQNGLFEQFVRISNSTPQSFPNGVRLLIKGLDTTNRVYNATGTNAGIPYIDVRTPLPSQGFVDVLVQYYIPNPRSVPSPLLVAEPLPFTVPMAGPPTLVIAGATEEALVLRFTTVAGRLYYLQSSDDFVNWAAVPGLINGTGGEMQCTPALGAGKKFFRVLLLP